MRRVFFAVILLVVAALAACGRAEAEAETVNVAVLTGPSALGSLWLMDAAERGETRNDYEIAILGGPMEIPPLLAQGLVDIAAVPTNLASVIYNQTGDITVLAISTMGVLHLVDATGEVAAVADLRGRTVHLSPPGAAPEFVFNFVLRQNGLEPGVDVDLVFHAEPPQIGALLASGAAEIALLPEPFATTVLMQNENLRHALDLTEEWGRVEADSALVMTAIIVRNEFLAENRAAVDIFLEEFEQSINFVNNNVSDAAELAVAFGIIPNVNIAAQAIPRSNQVFVTDDRMKRYLSGYLAVLYEQMPASIGGSKPDEDFYLVR